MLHPGCQDALEYTTLVDRRAGTLMEEYRQKADNMDRLLGEEGDGRMRRKLVLLLNLKEKGIQGGIITSILASRMQQSLEPGAKFSAELMQNNANSAKPMRQTSYFEQSICSKGLRCGEVKTLCHPDRH